jgi:hypothetical protein
MTRLRNIASVGALLVCACAPGEGQVDVRAWGEAYIEAGIPADAVTDGWAISFDRFEIEVRDIYIAGASLEDPDPIDLTAPSEGRGQLLGRAAVAAGDHEDAEFTLVRVELEGSAEKDGMQKTFAWVFDTPVTFRNCEATTEVPREGVGELQITVHADHLFYDSLVSEQPAIRFDLIAMADADADGEVTMAELSAADIGAYDPGNLAIDDLWSFIAAQAHTMGHVDGEGHCQS